MLLAAVSLSYPRSSHCVCAKGSRCVGTFVLVRNILQANRAMNGILNLQLSGRLSLGVIQFDLELDLVEVVFSATLSRLEPILNLLAHLRDTHDLVYSFLGVDLRLACVEGTLSRQLDLRSCTRALLIENAATVR